MAAPLETDVKNSHLRAAISRRDLLVGVAGATTALLLSDSDALAAADDGWEAALKKIIGEATPVNDKIKLEMPEIAENGNTVPFSVSVDSPMTTEDYVK